MIWIKLERIITMDVYQVPWAYAKVHLLKTISNHHKTLYVHYQWPIEWNLNLQMFWNSHRYAMKVYLADRIYPYSHTPFTRNWNLKINWRKYNVYGKIPVPSMLLKNLSVIRDLRYLLHRKTLPLLVISAGLFSTLMLSTLWQIDTSYLHWDLSYQTKQREK